MNAIVCDNCGSQLLVDKNGDDEYGERAAWLTIVTSFGSVDVCTLQCGRAILHPLGTLATAIDDQLVAVAEIARVIREQ